MATVRCKFVCVTTGKQMNWDRNKPFLHTARFTPVSSDQSPENRLFWEATPTGQLEVGTIKTCPFEPGKEYYIGIIPAE